jgi:hypothetical protein
MRLSQYIRQLQTLLETQGDLEVDSVSSAGERREAWAPWIAYRKILTGRESKPRFWYKGLDESLCGEKVVRI